MSEIYYRRYRKILELYRKIYGKGCEVDGPFLYNNILEEIDAGALESREKGRGR